MRVVFIDVILTYGRGLSVESSERSDFCNNLKHESKISKAIFNKYKHCPSN